MGRIQNLLLSWFSINIRMLPAKFAFILYGGILGLHLPFLNIFFTSVGLSTSQAGFISGIRYIASSLSGPLWGILADYTGRRKLIMAFICLGSVFPIFTMPWIANAIYPNDTCVSQRNTTNNTLLTITDKECEEERHDKLETLFYVFLAIVVFSSIFVISMPGYVDAIVINVVKTDENNASYGAQRNFGSVGFSMFTFLGGWAADKYNYPGMSHYTAVFYMYVPICLLLIPVGCYLVEQGKKGEEKIVKENMETKSHTEQIDRGASSWENSISRKVFLLFKKFDVLFFMITVFISGLANSIFLSFSLLLIQDTMNVSKTEMTLITVTGTLSELLIFPITSKLIKKLGGTSPCIIIGTFSYVIRFLSMSYVSTFWIIVLLQMLHGIGFALSWAAMMEYTHKISPKDIVVTMFGILSGIFFSLSAMVSNMLGGIVYETYSGRILFRWVAVICGVWTGLMIIYYGAKYLKNRSFSRNDNSIKYVVSVNENDNTKGKVTFDMGIVNPMEVIEDKSPEARTS